MMTHVHEYAKAYAGAAALLITVLVGKVGLDLPDEITAAVAILLTPVVVAIVPNKSSQQGQGRVGQQ